MKIRQYTANTMQEAILKIKVDLGPHAVILHTRKFKRGGVLGFFAQEAVEVLAAIDPEKEKAAAAAAAKAEAAPAPVARPASMAAHMAAAEGIDLGPLAAPSRTAATAPAAPRPDARNEAQAMARELLAAAAAAQAARAAEMPRLEFAKAEAARLAAESARSGGAQTEAIAVFGEAENQNRRAHAGGTATLIADDEDAGPPRGRAAEARMGEPKVTMMPAGKLADEVGELRNSVSELKAMMGSLVGQLEITPRNAAQFPTLLQKIYDRLLELDVEPSIARGLVIYLQKEAPHLKTYEELCDALEAPVSGLFSTSGPIAPVTGQQTIVALVGATGVGKTTTIAKLAANFTLGQKVDLALLTIDTYRVAAIEQLKTYGDIIGMPVEVVLTPQSLKDALKLHHDKGMILIDTAGRSPYNRLHINELRSFLDVEPRVETHLVVSATTRLADLKQIVKNFASTGVDRLIFSKTDETDIVGGVISIAHETGLPVSYITTGQSVPDDIMVAEGPALARMLIQQLKV